MDRDEHRSGLDAPVGQAFGEIIAAAAKEAGVDEARRQPRRGVCPVGILPQADARHIGELPRVDGHNFTPPPHDHLATFHLTAEDRGSHIREPVIEAHYWKVVTPGGIHALAAEHSHAALETGVVECHRPPLAAGDDLVAEEGERGSPRERPDGPALVRGEGRLGGILDHPEAMGRCDRIDRIHVGGMTEQVNGDDALCAAGDRGLNEPRVEAPVVGINIDEDRRAAAVGDGVGRGDVGHRRHDHFVARADAERGQGEVQGRGAIGGGDGMGGSTGLGKLPLKSIEERTRR